MKKNARQGAIRRKLAAIAVAACFAAPGALANPTGANVVRGTAAIHQAGNLLQITNSPSAIINWQSFSIGAGETTRFIQQSPASAVLNRVVGGDPSSILGALQSNGRVFLINPNGILFGAGARIDVGGLVASTLRLSDEDFLGGRLNFQADPAKAAAAVVNQGRITAGAGGQVFLAGSAVDNQGVITAPNGDIVLAAGNSVRVTESAGSPLQVEITAPADRAVNLSEALYGSRGLYGGLVRNSGTLNASSAVQEADGRIVLKASHDVTLEKTSRITANGARGGSVSVQAEMGTLLAEGVIEATGSETTGGRIELLGERVGLIGSMKLDASGSAGGGTILVGGDYHGGNPDVPNAGFSYVAREVEIRADVGEKGDGGKVVVWADDTTRYYGTIGARGGAQGGDGGFVEVSGKQSLEFDGTVNTSAPRGATGTLLLDPSDITISIGANANMTAGPTFTALAATGTLNTGTLQTSLASNNVIVDTTSVSGNPGNITVANAVTWASAQSLTLQAHNNITVSAGATITATGGGAITMIADQELNGTGALAINANVSSTGGAISLTGVGATIAAATTVNSGAGNLTVNARTGTLTTNANSLLLTTGTATVIANGATINTASSQIGGTGAGAGSAARVILRPFTAGTTIGLAGGAGTLNLTAAELARVRATDVRIGDSTSGNLVVNAWIPAATFAPGVLTLQTGGTVAQGGVINLATSTSDLVLRAGGNITLGSANVLGSVAASSTAGAISLTNAANNTFTVTSLTDDIGALSGISGLNSVTMTTSGTGGINVQQPINTTNAAISLASGSGGINLSTGTADLAPGSGNVTIDAGTGLFNMAAGSSIVTSGNVTVSANTIGLAGLVQATGAASVVKLAPDTAATAVSLGAGAAAGFALTDVELNTIEAPIVRIGDGTGAAPYAGATTGAITATGDFTPDAQFGTSLLELRTTGAITATAGALNFGTSGGNLVMRSGGNINLGTAAHDFNTVAAVSSVAASTITVRDGVNAMTVGTVDGVAGVSTGSGAIAVQAPNGLLSVNSNVTKSVAGAGQAISLSGNGVTVAGGVTVNARAGDATLDAGAGTLTTGAATLVLTTAVANLVGDAMALNATSQFGGTAAGTGSAATATLRQSTNGTTLGLAGGTGTLNLDATELATVRATTVRIGDTNSGAMEIGAWTPTATFAPTVLGLASGAGITQTGPIDLATSTSDLLVRGAGNVVLTNTNNNFGNIAASMSAGSLAVTNRANSGLTVTSLNDGLGAAAGVTAPGGVALTTSGTGTITVAQPISTTNAAISLSSGSGGVRLNGANSDLASGAGDATIDAGTGLFNMAAGSSIVTSGNVTVSSNTIALAGLVQATGPASVVKLAPDTAATAINLGTGAAAGFALTNTELNTIQSPIVRIGDGTGAAPYAGATSGNITISGAFASAATFATSFLELRTTGTVTATAAAVNLAAGTTDLVVRAGGVVNIANAGHDLQTVAVTATNSAVTLTEGATGMTVGTVDGLSGIAAGSGSIAVTSGGLLTVNDNVTRTGAGTIALTGVGITQGASSTIGGGAGTVTLDANDGAYNLAGSITTISAAANAVQVLDAGSAVLGNISATAGGVVLGQAGANNLSGAVSQSGGTSIQSAQLSVAGGSTVTLGATANDFTGTVTIASGTVVTINDATALSFGASTVSGNLSVTAAGAITDSGNVSVTGTTTLAAGGGNNITLDNANNFGGSVSVVSANNVTLNDINALDLGSMSVNSSLSATAGGAINQSGVAVVGGGMTLTAGGAITQSAAAVVGGNLSMTAAGAITQTASSTVGGTTSLTTNVAGADVLFNDPANQLGGNVSVSTTGAGSDADIRGTGGLAFAASNVGGSFTGVATTGNLTLNGAITAGAAGDSIVLATPGNFINNAGAGALTVPGGGRWLVYSTDPRLDTRGGLESAYAFKHYGLTYTGPYGGPGTGNGLIYSFTPNVTPGLTGSASRGYDGTMVAPTGSLVVVPPGTDVIDSDTVTLAFAGATYDTKHVGATKLVTVSGISIATQTNAGRPVYGYTTDSTASANVGTITPAGLALNALSDTKVYDGGTSSGATPTSVGLVGGDTVGALSQAFASKNVLGANASTLNVNAGYVVNDGNAGNNYTVTLNAASGTITPAGLAITANDASRAANQPNPPFSATYSGFQLGDTAADLTGTLSFSTPATLNSPGGAYAITPFGQASSNYVFTYVNGTLTISTAPLSPATFVNPLIPAVNSFVPDPQVAPSGAPAVVAMDSSLTPLPATAAGSEEGAGQSAVQPARPVEDTWRCFRSGSILSRQCR